MPGYSPTGPKNPYKATGQVSGFGGLAVANPYRQPGKFDTQLAHGPTDVREQFKGLPATGFTPGSNAQVGGTILFQQRLRLMFLELVRSGMSHKDAAVHIQKTTGFHARTGQKIVAKTEHTKQKKIKYGSRYITHKPYRGTAGRSGHHRPRRPTPYGTPAGLK